MSCGCYCHTAVTALADLAMFPCFIVLLGASDLDPRRGLEPGWEVYAASQNVAIPKGIVQILGPPYLF